MPIWASSRSGTVPTTMLIRIGRLLKAGPAAVVHNEGCGSLSCIYVEVEVQATIDRIIWMKSTLGQPADDRRAELGCDTRYGGGFSRSCMSGPKWAARRLILYKASRFKRLANLRMSWMPCWLDDRTGDDCEHKLKKRSSRVGGVERNIASRRRGICFFF